jgi:hypothetical protein
MMMNTTRTTFAFDECFVWKLAPVADEESDFFITILFLEVVTFEVVNLIKCLVYVA